MASLLHLARRVVHAVGGRRATRGGLFGHGGLAGILGGKGGESAEDLASKASDARKEAGRTGAAATEARSTAAAAKGGAATSAAESEAAAQALAKLTASLGPLVANLGRFESVLLTGSDAAKKAVLESDAYKQALAAEKVLTDAKKAAAVAENKATDAKGKATVAQIDAEGATKKHVDASEKAIGATQKADAAKDAGGGIGAALGQFAAVAGAATQVVGALQGMFDTVKSWVAALNPGIVKIFDQELQNLNATLGQAFMPVIEMAIHFVRMFADAISPTMQALRPVIEQLTAIAATNIGVYIKFLTDTFASLVPTIQLLIPIFQLLSSVLRAMIETALVFLMPLLIPLQFLVALLNPLLEVLVKIIDLPFDLLSQAMDAMMRVIDALQASFGILGTYIINAVSALFGFGKLGGVIDWVTKAFQTLITYIVMFIAWMAKFLGQDTFLKELESAFRKEPPEGTRAIAAGQTSIKGIEQISKDLAVASAQAQGTSKTSNEEKMLEFNKAMADGIAGIRADNRGLGDVLKQYLLDPLVNWIDRLVGQPVKGVERAVVWIKEKYEQGANTIGKAKSAIQEQEDKGGIAAAAIGAAKGGLNKLFGG